MTGTGTSIMNETGRTERYQLNCSLAKNINTTVGDGRSRSPIIAGGGMLELQLRLDLRVGDDKEG